MKIQRILSLANVNQNIIEEVKTLYDKVAKNMNIIIKFLIIKKSIKI
jgi:hypothetical protein